MRKRNLKYYYRTILLKSNAFMHRLMANLPQHHKKRAALKEEYLLKFESLDLNFLKNQPTDLFYYTYGHFLQPQDLAASLLFDDNGIAFSSVNNAYRQHVNPLFSAYYGLVCYNHYYQTGDEESLRSFWKQVHFLQSYGHWQGDCFILPYQFDYPPFGLKAPWVAGITQALAASLFYRAALLQTEMEYSSLFKGAVKTMFSPRDEGGTFCTTPDGYPWIEEFPSDPPSFVFNGFIFCVIAVIEYARFSGDTYYNKKAIKLLRSLVARLHHYKYGKYIRHSFRNWNFSNLEYQGLYVFQFVHLYKLTKLELFKELALELETTLDWKDFFYFYQMPSRNIKVEDFLTL